MAIYPGIIQRGLSRPASRSRQINRANQKLYEAGRKIIIPSHPFNIIKQILITLPLVQIVRLTMQSLRILPVIFTRQPRNACLYLKTRMTLRILHGLFGDIEIARDAVKLPSARSSHSYRQ